MREGRKCILWGRRWHLPLTSNAYRQFDSFDVLFFGCLPEFVQQVTLSMLCTMEAYLVDFQVGHCDLDQELVLVDFVGLYGLN